MSASVSVRPHLVLAALAAGLGAALVVVALRGHGMGTLVAGGIFLGLAVGWLIATLCLRHRSRRRIAAVVMVVAAVVGATAGGYLARLPVVRAAPDALPAMAIRPAHAHKLTSMGQYGRTALVDVDLTVHAYSLDHPDNAVWSFDRTLLLRIDHGLVILFDGHGGMVARRISDGSVAWRDHDMAPAIRPVGGFGHLMLLQPQDSNVAVAIDVRTGAVAWRRRGTPSLGDLMVTTPPAPEDPPVYDPPLAANVLRYGPYAAIEQHRKKGELVTIVDVVRNRPVLRRMLPSPAEYFVSPTHFIYDAGNGHLVAAPIAGDGKNQPVDSVREEGTGRPIGVLRPGPFLPGVKPLPTPWTLPTLLFPVSYPSTAFEVADGERRGIWDTGTGRVTTLPSYDWTDVAADDGDIAQIGNETDAVGQVHGRLDVIHGDQDRVYRIHAISNAPGGSMAVSVNDGLVCVDTLGCSPVSALM